MKRIVLFLATNLAILVILGLVLNLTGANRFLTGSGINYQTLLVFSLIVGFTGSFISLAISKWMAKMAYRIQVIDQPRSQTERWLVETVAAQAKRARIPMPEVGIYDSPEANAFATGPSRRNSIVAVSTGLLEQMTPREVEGVLAHEVAHIANGDMVTMTLLQGVMNTFVVFLSRVVGFFVDRIIFRREDEGVGIGYFIAVFVFEIIFGILASMVVLWHSRRREFAADADAARIWGKDAMLGALLRLQEITSRNPVFDHRSEALKAFKINGEPKGVMALFLTHPPLSKRIEALRALPT